MRTDLNSLKTELNRLTDMKYLKKEINRIAVEVKNFDVQRHLSPQAKVRIETLESRFRDALKNLKELQKQVDANLERVLDVVRTRSFGANGKGRRKGKRTAKKQASPSNGAVKKKAAGKSKRASKKAARH